MNQSIIFTDQLYIEADKVKFIAQQQGANINCYARFSTISQLCEQQEVNLSNAANLFELCRFDLEDKAEAQIEREVFNDKGDVEI
ncbi:DUF1488 domain-containing protein [Shewanella litoralis]|uniref:Transcriptional regulator n=1 Tax=Shewanella litoralis TaxID=2282700 RepID=A0ABQ2RG46_9GAMM|nr:DUF1488 domain-containing protein [Shewanella litoralis]GGQ26067.1 transcriptional regulator [Shewanella litoralis]